MPVFYYYPSKNLWIYNIVIYNKKYILDLHSIPATYFPKTCGIFWVLQADEGVFCYVGEVTFRKPLGHLRMGAGCQWGQPWD